MLLLLLFGALQPCHWHLTALHHTTEPRHAVEQLSDCDFDFDFEFDVEETTNTNTNTNTNTAAATTTSSGSEINARASLSQLPSSRPPTGVCVFVCLFACLLAVCPRYRAS